jgi:SAM-dependent methyltransferase
MENEPYFESIRREYREAIDFSHEVYANIAAQLAPLLRGRVVDFGNGGVINYDTSGLESLLCVDVVAHATASAPNVRFVQGDFHDFEIPAGTDVVLMQFLLHHLTDEARLEPALARVAQRLVAGGRLVVVEMLLPGPLEQLQRALRPLTAAGLRAAGKPDLRFFSRASLAARLQRAGFASLAFRKVAVGRRIAPAPVLVPALRIPGWLYPLDCVVVEARP